MSQFERTLRRSLNAKKRLNKAEALVLQEMALADGYLSRSERKVMLKAIEQDLLNDDAFEVFIETLMQEDLRRSNHGAA